MEDTFCPICSDRAEIVSRDIGFIEFDCPHCGRFRMSPSALETIDRKSREELEALLNSARQDAQGGGWYTDYS